jgi:hypothetical protein
VNAILRPVYDCLLTLVYGLLAFTAGGALVWQYGTSWLSRVMAALAAVVVFAAASSVTFSREDVPGD